MTAPGCSAKKKPEQASSTQSVLGSGVSYAAADIIQRRIGRRHRHAVINRAIAGPGADLLRPTLWVMSEAIGVSRQARILHSMVSAPVDHAVALPVAFVPASVLRPLPRQPRWLQAGRGSRRVEAMQSPALGPARCLAAKQAAIYQAGTHTRVCSKKNAPAEAIQRRIVNYSKLLTPPT